MTQITLGLSPPRKHNISENCPFCPGKKEKDWDTFPGKANNSGKLKDNMLDPERNGYAQQNGARPKDGKEGRQNPDKKQDEPSFKRVYKGKKLNYTFQAHHSISGNEIIKGEPIEKFYLKGKTVKKHTGYTINNCANGIFLPSYPDNYPGGWGNIEKSRKDPDKEMRTAIMKPAMDKHGQAHIGSHTGFNDEGYPKHTNDYVVAVREYLDEIEVNLNKWSEKCAFCEGPDEKPKKPFPPPYKLNAILDRLSKGVARHIGSKNAKKWEYFISSYAHIYHKKVCTHRKRKKPG